MKKNWTGERWETDVQNETALEHLHRYAMAMELTAGKDVLDIACGEGYGSRLMAANARTVTGVDIDTATIAAASQKYKASQLRFITGEATRIPLPDQSVDVVVSFETLEHLGDHDVFLGELKRVMRPAALLIISTPDKDQYTLKSGYTNPFHIKELNRPDFEALLGKYFKQVKIFIQETCHSSVISSPGVNQFNRYTGNHEQIIKNATPEALYLVALVSDTELPAIPGSFFNGHSVLEQALSAEKALLKSTLTYRIGHVLLSPFKWVKKLFT